MAEKKSEHMTSLSGEEMVPKTHRRITFRGRIDTLEAEVIEAQVLAAQQGEREACERLGEILGLLRSIMAAEVKGTPLPPPVLFGMAADEIRRRSHEAFVAGVDGKPLFPAHTQGPLAARLNTLRAKTREAELLAVEVFGPAAAAEGLSPEREDIVLALNRLSGALWWLFCGYVNFTTDV